VRSTLPVLGSNRTNSALVQNVEIDPEPQGGKAVLALGYGMANLEHKVPAEPETVFRIASMTKQFTATAILLLAQEHLLSTNDKLSRFFPEFPRSDEVTIRQLLTHTSGLPSYDAKPEYRSFRLQPHTNLELMNWIKADPYVAEPGSQDLYSNSGYLLLAGIIEKVSGESFRDFLKGRVFDPLGLTRTQVVQDDATLSKSGGGICSSGRSVWAVFECAFFRCKQQQWRDIHNINNWRSNAVAQRSVWRDGFVTSFPSGNDFAGHIEKWRTYRHAIVREWLWLRAFPDEL
jgi:CubicO group peptidase (beta-lactamase class C family)